MQEVLQDKIGFKVKLEEQRDKLEMLVVENATLKEKVQQLEDDCKRVKNQVKKLNLQLDQASEAKILLEKTIESQKWVEVQLRSKEVEIEEQRLTVQNLQRAMQQSTEEFDQQMRMREREQNDERLIISTLTFQNNEMKERMKELAHLQE